MSHFGSTDWLIQIMMGNIPGHAIINKFGYNSAVGTVMVPIAMGGIYPSPIVNTSLEIVSDSADDNAAGTGIRSVEVKGLNLAGAEVTETITLNGTTEVALTNSFFRVFRLKSKTSGTYANADIPSHSSTITLQETGGGAPWGSINNNAGFGLGQSQIGAYTIPAGKTGFLLTANIVVNGVKDADIYIFTRDASNNVTAPYDTMRIMQEFHTVTGEFKITTPSPLRLIPEMSDVGLLGKTAQGTTGVTGTMQLLLVDN